MSNGWVRHLYSARMFFALTVLALGIGFSGCGGSSKPAAAPESAAPAADARGATPSASDPAARKPAAEKPVAAPADNPTSAPKVAAAADGTQIPGVTDAPRTALAMGGFSKVDTWLNMMAGGVGVLEQQNPMIKMSLDQFRSQSLLYTGVDVTIPANLAKIGLDIGKPITFAVTEFTPKKTPGGMVLSAGVTDEDALKRLARKLADKEKVTVQSDTRGTPAVEMIGKEMALAIADKRAYLMVGDRTSDLPVLLRAFLDQKARAPLGVAPGLKTAMDALGGAGDINAHVDLATIIANASAAAPALAKALQSVTLKAGEKESAAYLAVDSASALRKNISPGAACSEFVAKMDKPLALVTFSVADPMQLIKMFAESGTGIDMLKQGSARMKAQAGMDMEELGELMKNGAGGIGLFKSQGPLPVSYMLFVKVQSTDAQKIEKAKSALMFVLQQGLPLPPPLTAQLQSTYANGFLAIGTAAEQIQALNGAGPARWKPHYGNKEFLSMEYFIADTMKHMQSLNPNAPIANPFGMMQAEINVALKQKGDGLIFMSDSSQASVATVAMIAAIAVPSLLRSRMAANETAGAACCKAYAEAQEIYHRTDYNKDGVLEYAQALKGDWSLIETKAGLNDVSMIDLSFGDAEGPPSKSPTPKAGYCFKVLKGQGAAAPGGKRSYLSGTRMTLGYALLAYPARYDSTGRNMFMINNSGTLFMKDAGPETEALAEQMTEFNPDQTWIPTE
jgi:hypothetical protein